MRRGGPGINHQFNAFFSGWLFAQCSGEAWERSQMRTAGAEMQEAYSRLPLLASPMMPRPVRIGAGARVPQPYTARGTLINSASTTSHTMCVPSIKHAREIVFESGSKLAHCVWASTSFANVESGSKSGQYNFLSPGACHGPVGPRSYSVTWGGNYGKSPCWWDVWPRRTMSCGQAEKCRWTML